VAEVTVNVALTPLNVTAVARVKFVPLIVTLVPTAPLVGVKPVIVGGFTTVKLVALVAVLRASSRLEVPSWPPQAPSPESPWLNSQ